MNNIKSYGLLISSYFLILVLTVGICEDFSNFIRLDKVLLMCTVADPECARGGGVSHILAEKGLLASLY